MLDIMIPGSDGLELCRHIRQVKSLAATPIIFLTAKVMEGDRVRGLESGGDDYITKPFSPREMVARVRAVLRSQQEPPQPDVLRMGDLEIDVASMGVKIAGRSVTTTMMEFRLLNYFATHPGRV